MAVIISDLVQDVIRSVEALVNYFGQERDATVKVSLHLE